MPVNIAVPVRAGGDTPQGLIAYVNARLPAILPRLVTVLVRITPRRTGRTARSWRVEVSGGAVRVRNPTPYARWIWGGRFSSLVMALTIRYLRQAGGQAIADAIVAWLNTDEGLAWILSHFGGPLPDIVIQVG